MANRVDIWHGTLEWFEKENGPTDGHVKVARQADCKVSAKDVNGEPEVKGDDWPQRLIMQLIPKNIVGSLGGNFLVRDVKTAEFVIQRCDALNSLTRIMDSGYAGCVHFTGGTGLCAIKVLILLYSKDKLAFLGFIPNDQASFVDRIRTVIQQQKRSQTAQSQLQLWNPQQPGNMDSQNLRTIQQIEQTLQVALSGPGEKCRLIQNQLVLLLHAHKCQRRDSEASNGENPNCLLPHCRAMKNVLTHLMNCQAGRNCTEPHCFSSRQIISHWKHCTRGDCEVCLPIKQGRNSMNASQPSQAAAATIPPPSLEVRGTCAGIGAPRPPMAEIPTATPPQRHAPPVSVRQNQSSVLPSVASPQPRPCASSTMFPGSDNPIAMLSLDQIGTRPAHGLEITASTMQCTKEWHQSLSLALRNHLVHKLVIAIFPSPDPAAIQDRRMGNLVEYAKKVERDMYEAANCRSEYYHLLAEKIYKIQKELHEKRQRRYEQRSSHAPTESQLLSNSTLSSIIFGTDQFDRNDHRAVSTSRTSPSTSTAALVDNGPAVAPSTSTSAMPGPSRMALSFECSVCLETLDMPASISLSPQPSASSSIDLDDEFELDFLVAPRVGRRRRGGGRRQRATATRESTSLTDIVATGCGHLYHRACLMQWFKENGRRTCPSCRAIVPAAKLVRLYPNIIDADARTGADVQDQTRANPDQIHASAEPSGSSGSPLSPIQLDDDDGSDIAGGRCTNENCQDLRDIHSTLMNDYTDLQTRFNLLKEEEAIKDAQISTLTEDNTRKEAEIAVLKRELREMRESGTSEAANASSAKRPRQ